MCFKQRCIKFLRWESMGVGRRTCRNVEAPPNFGEIQGEWGYVGILSIGDSISKSIKLKMIMIIYQQNNSSNVNTSLCNINIKQ